MTQYNSQRGGMLDQARLQELGAKLSELLSKTPARDIEKNLRSIVTGFLSRLDLVTREEFDVQSAVLRRTREKLEQLEAKLEQLERDRPGPPV
jgi:BMFP domain-containing protein YqiC